MRLLILFVGLFSLLFFNHEGNTIRQNHHDFSNADNLYCFEAGRLESIWGFEKTESCQSELSDGKISQNKKRFYETNLKSFGTTDKIASTITGFKLVPDSKINLFLIYHFSQSLWQVFLQ